MFVCFLVLLRGRKIIITWRERVLRWKYRRGALKVKKWKEKNDIKMRKKKRRRRKKKNKKYDI